MSDLTPNPLGSYTEADHPFASRGGLKLDTALAESGIDPTGMTCADLGCSTGGFTSCLLLRGAERVFAVDTAYGILDYTLRMDPRVVVMERSNALHTEPPEVQTPLSEADPTAAGGAAQASERVQVDLVAIDLGWTKQDKALAVARRWLKPTGRIITLVKPHYEQPRATPERRGKGKAKPTPLEAEEARAIAQNVLAKIDADPALGLEVLGSCDSPIRGSKGGNLEVIAWLGVRA